MRFVAAIVFLAHGLAHLVGFVGGWRLSATVPYKTTVLAGRLDVGNVGSRIMGLLWLFIAIDFGIVAWGAWSGYGWWPFGGLVTALGSLLLCLIAWPDAAIGAYVNLGIVAWLMFWRMGWGLLRLW